MKAVIVQCLEELVKTKFGNEKWEQIKSKSGIDKNKVFYISEDIDDTMVINMLTNTCSILNISLQQAADAFGDYWVNTFAPKIYKNFYEGCKTAREFILKMDSIHEIVTKNIKGARPPRFEYKWESDNALLMKYNSSRGLIDILSGLVKGVGTYFREKIVVEKIGTSQLRILFLA